MSFTHYITLPKTELDRVFIETGELLDQTVLGEYLETSFQADPQLKHDVLALIASRTSADVLKNRINMAFKNQFNSGIDVYHIVNPVLHREVELVHNQGYDQAYIRGISEYYDQLENRRDRSWMEIQDYQRNLVPRGYEFTYTGEVIDTTEPHYQAYQGLLKLSPETFESAATLTPEESEQVIEIIRSANYRPDSNQYKLQRLLEHRYKHPGTGWHPGQLRDAIANSGLAINVPPYQNPFAANRRYSNDYVISQAILMDDVGIEVANAEDIKVRFDRDLYLPGIFSERIYLQRPYYEALYRWIFFSPQRQAERGALAQIPVEASAVIYQPTSRWFEVPAWQRQIPRPFNTLEQWQNFAATCSPETLMQISINDLIVLAEELDLPRREGETKESLCRSISNTFALLRGGK